MRVADWPRFLKLVKQVLGVTTAELAVVARVKRPTVEKWLYRRGGYRSVALESICLYLEARGFDATDLMRRASEPRPASGRSRIARYLTEQENAIVAAWHRAEENTALIETIEFHFKKANIPLPVKPRRT